MKVANMASDRRAIVAFVISILVVFGFTVSLHRPTYDAILDKVDKVSNPNKEKVAYVTFLSGTSDEARSEDLENDKYFVATRILIWQLLHVPKTRTKHDVVVMVTPSVTRSRRERLARDGAIVYPVEFLKSSRSDWIHAEFHRWDDVMTKLRVWEMTQYSRMLMVDGDTLVRENLDGIFEDPGAQIQQTGPLGNYTILDGQPPLPSTYLLGSLSEVWDSTHDFPPKDGTGLKKVGYLNAGFFLLQPDKQMFDYLRSFLDIKNSFDPQYPEQNLMNQIHKWGGPMPWKEVSYHWNIRCPTENDFAKGLVSMHEKWWTQPYIYNNEKVKDWLKAQRWEMKGWWDGRESSRVFS